MFNMSECQCHWGLLLNSDRILLPDSIEKCNSKRQKQKPYSSEITPQLRQVGLNVLCEAERRKRTKESERKLAENPRKSKTKKIMSRSRGRPKVLNEAERIERMKASKRKWWAGRHYKSTQSNYWAILVTVCLLVMVIACVMMLWHWPHLLVRWLRSKVTALIWYLVKGPWEDLSIKMTNE